MQKEASTPTNMSQKQGSYGNQEEHGKNQKKPHEEYINKTDHAITKQNSTR